MSNLSWKKGSLHIHRFYIGQLEAKAAQLMRSDAELSDLLSSSAALLEETATALASEIAEEEYGDEVEG